MPGVPTYLAARAKQLGLERHELVARLLHNYLHGPPIGLPVVDESPRRLKRPIMQVSLPSRLRAEGKRAAKRWRLSFSQLITALAVHDAEAGQEELVLHPVRGAAKPTLAERD